MGRFEKKWLSRPENLAALADLPGHVFNQFGDVERCVVRPGNVHSADGWRAVLESVIARYREAVQRLYFRGDAWERENRLNWQTGELRPRPVALPEMRPGGSLSRWIRNGETAALRKRFVTSLLKNPSNQYSDT